MRKVLVLLLAIMLATPAIQGQDDKKTGKIGYKFKMQEARHMFLTERNVRGALNIYRELKKDFTNDPMVNYRIGECQYALRNFGLAVEYFQNARKLDENVDDDLFLNLGQAYHMNGQLDEAIEAYEKYNSVASKRDRRDFQIAKRIAALDFAKKMIASPVDVKITNLGESINSRGGDYAPSISADGRTMIFTSRRANTMGGEVDKEGDYKYFEDIYLSEWDTVDQKWKEARPIEGRLNTEGHDASLSISPDGKQVFIYRNDGEVYIGDIFMSKKRSSGNGWGSPRALDKPINTSYFESSACLSADGNKLYFVSEREGKKNGAQGQGDIYVAERLSRTQWSEPKNLGPVINTSGDEISVFIHPDGKTLFFSSNGHLSIGGLDIFMSRMQEDGSWGKPENLGYPINTIDDDVHFILATDGKTAHYSAVKEEGYGERDIYKIDMSNYPILSEGVSINLSILHGNIKSGDDEVMANVVFKDEAGKDVGKTICNDEGYYFITLPGGQKYTVEVTAEGYEKASYTVDLPLGEGSTAIVSTNVELTKTPESK